MIHNFDRDLMNTKLDLLIGECDKKYAYSAAYEGFEKIAFIESLLSMYAEGSDIDIINSAPLGEIITLNPYTCDCLLKAFWASSISGGAIDVCMGDYFSKMKSGKASAKIEIQHGKFEIDPENFCIKKTGEGKIDLGCIGKGFAIDELVDMLREEWEIKSAFANFGGSSIYAFGKQDDEQLWKVNLSETASIDIPASGMAIGASGTAVLGTHIFDARNGEIPQNQPFRTWAFSSSAAVSDAMSTAFMILDEASIKKICAENDISAAIQKTEDSPVVFI